MAAVVVAAVAAVTNRTSDRDHALSLQQLATSGDQGADHNHAWRAVQRVRNDVARIDASKIAAGPIGTRNCPASAVVFRSTLC